MQGALSVFAQHPVVDFAGDVSRYVPDHLPHDLVVNAARHLLHMGADEHVDIGGAHSPPFDAGQVHQRPSRLDGMYDALARVQVVLQKDLAGKLGGAFFLNLAPRIRARVLDRAGVVCVRLDLPTHVVVA